MKKKTEQKKVTVKIAITSVDQNGNQSLSLSSSGKQVEMLDSEENYIKKAVTQMEKAQKILEKYYNQ